MNVRQALSETIERLKNKNIKTASLDAIIILKEALNKDDIFILSNPDYELSKDEAEKTEAFVAMREKLYPMGYIRGKKEFYSFDFFVNNDVLIPRPETEMLVDKVLELAKFINKPVIVDVGTGSGCIAVSVAKFLSDALIIASDISYKALIVAKKNSDNLNVEIEFIQADMLSFLKNKVDIIVSNPPYIEEGRFDTLQEDVKYEPKEALLCPNGTDIIEKLIKGSKKLCSYLVLEIGENQENFVKGFEGFVEIQKDFANLARMAVFRFD